MDIVRKSPLIPDTPQVPSSDARLARDAGMHRYAERTSRRARRLAEFGNRFEELDKRRREALLDGAPHSGIALRNFDPEDGLAENVLRAIAEEVAAAKGMTDLTVWQIDRGDRLEWAIVGMYSYRETTKTFLLLRWGVVVEPLSVLVERYDRRRQEASSKEGRDTKGQVSDDRVEWVDGVAVMMVAMMVLGLGSIAVWLLVSILRVVAEQVVIWTGHGFPPLL